MQSSSYGEVPLLIHHYSLTQASPARGVQPTARRLHADQAGYKCGPTKIINLLKAFFFAHQILLVFVYLMCGPRQLFLQCGPEMPKVWTPLLTHGDVS